MAITVSWSLTNGGTEIDSLDHGSAGNGTSSTVKTIHLRHNGVYSITECGIYIRAIPTGYAGDFTADADIAEILGWGDGADASSFGGMFLNLNATGSFPVASWPTLATKSVLSGGDTIGVALRTGVGDSPTSAVPVVTEMGCSVDDEVQAGSAPNVRFQCKFAIPPGESTLGARSIRMSLTYDYTS